MVFAYFTEKNMKRICFEKTFDYLINNIGYVNVLRNAGYCSSFQKGKCRYTFVFVTSGEMNYYFPNKKNSVILKKGTILFIPKEYPYIATYTKNNTVANVLTFEMFDEKFPEHFQSPMVKTLTSYVDFSNTVNSNNEIFLLSKIYELLNLIKNKDNSISDKYRRILPAIDDIQQNYHENNHVSYYADMCCMSESNFRKIFKEYTGLSFIDFRNRIRALKAKSMIESGEFKVSEAARLNGFNNMSFFYEIYNKYSEEKE